MVERYDLNLKKNFLLSKKNNRHVFFLSCFFNRFSYQANQDPPANPDPPAADLQNLGLQVRLALLDLGDRKVKKVTESSNEFDTAENLDHLGDRVSVVRQVTWVHLEGKENPAIKRTMEHREFLEAQVDRESVKKVNQAKQVRQSGCQATRVLRATRVTLYTQRDLPGLKEKPAEQALRIKEKRVKWANLEDKSPRITEFRLCQVVRDHRDLPVGTVLRVRMDKKVTVERMVLTGIRGELAGLDRKVTKVSEDVTVGLVAMVLQVGKDLLEGLVKRVQQVLPVEQVPKVIRDQPEMSVTVKKHQMIKKVEKSR